MKARMTGTIRKHLSVELEDIDLLALIAGYKLHLANSNKSVADHIVSADAVDVLTKEVHDRLSKRGFADPAGIVEYLELSVLDYLKAREAVEAKIVGLLHNKVAYFSDVIRFKEPNFDNVCYWPNNSSDAP